MPIDGLPSHIVLDYQGRPRPRHSSSLVATMLCAVWTIFALIALIAVMLIIEMLTLMAIEFIIERFVEWRAVPVIALAFLCGLCGLGVTMRIGRKLQRLDADVVAPADSRA